MKHADVWHRRRNRIVAPPGNGGRGLKHNCCNGTSSDCIVAPPGNGGRGLKLARRSPLPPRSTVAPPGNGGRGLKQQGLLRLRRDRPGCAPRQRGARIETCTNSNGWQKRACCAPRQRGARIETCWRMRVADMTPVAPPGNGGRGLKHLFGGEPPAVEPGCAPRQRGARIETTVTFDAIAQSQGCAPRQRGARIETNA